MRSCEAPMAVYLIMLLIIISSLVNRGYKVAIVEQVEDPEAPGLIKRSRQGNHKGNAD